MAGWLVVLLVAVAVVAVCAVVLLGVGLVGVRRRSSTGPLVVAGRAVFVVLLLAVVVGLGAGLWGSISGALAALR